MTMLFNIGDEIKITMEGKIKEYSISENGDCYIIELSDVDPKGTRVYLNTPILLKTAMLKEQETVKNDS